MRTNRFPSLFASVLTLAALGCDDAHRVYGTHISFPEAQALLERGPRRLDLTVSPASGSVLVDELRVESDDELFHDEQLTLRVPETPFPVLSTDGGCTGTLAGAPAGEVRFDEAFTSFAVNGDAVSCADFVARITEQVSAGNAPLVRARRTPGPVPQDPDDPVFFARELDLMKDNSDVDQEREVRLNVGPASLTTCASVRADLDCVGALTLLGAPFVAREDVTELRSEFPVELIVFDLDDARVRNASATASELVLEGGRIVRIVDGTRIAGAKPNGEPRSATQLISVAEVEDAIARGEVVRIDGDAVLQTSPPISLLGIELDMQVDTSETGGVDDQVLAFQGPVLDVDPSTGIVTMPFETDVRVPAATPIEGDFTSLKDLDVAVGNGAAVRASVVGVVEETEPRLVVRATSLELTERPAQP